MSQGNKQDELKKYKENLKKKLQEVLNIQKQIGNLHVKSINQHNTMSAENKKIIDNKIKKLTEERQKILSTTANKIKKKRPTKKKSNNIEPMEHENKDSLQTKYDYLSNIVNFDILRHYSSDKLNQCKTYDIAKCKEEEYCKVKRTKKSTSCVRKDPYELGIMKKYPVCPYHNVEADCEHNKKCSWVKKTKRCVSKKLGKTFD